MTSHRTYFIKMAQDQLEKDYYKSLTESKFAFDGFREKIPEIKLQEIIKPSNNKSIFFIYLL